MPDNDPPPDVRLARARRGDIQAFTGLLREHDDAMRALVWSIVRDGWLMDDVLQAAYEKAFRALPGFRGESSFKTWLHRICYTTAIDALRYEGLRRHEDIDSHGELSGSSPGPATAVVERITLGEALAHLPEPQRTALVLVAVEGMSYDEAAGVCGTTAGTIASRVSRAKRRLQSLLGPIDERGGR